jgi:hypothetical protein
MARFYCKAVYDSIHNVHKYVTDFVNVSINLLNIETKETDIGIQDISLSTVEFSSVRLPTLAMLPLQVLGEGKGKVVPVLN